MWGFEHYGMGWGMVLVWLIPILLVAGIVHAMRGRNGPSGRTALEILEARYARGEIDRETFQKQRADLTD